jgi:hypothetical protein
MRWLFAAALLAPLSLHAQAPLILRLPASTRALSQGGAYPVTSPDADVIFYNPQLLSVARGFSLSAQRYGGDATLTTFAATLDANFGFGVQVLDYELPLGALRGSHVLLSDGGGPARSQAVAAVGYARTIKGVRLGIAGKWAQFWDDGVSDGVAALDVGSAINPISWLRVALAVQNIGNGFESGGIDYDLPLQASLNVSQQSRVVGPLDVALAGRLAGGPDVDLNGGLGVDISYWPFNGLTFSVRGGGRFGGDAVVRGTRVVEEGPVTAGAGVAFRRVTFDYAWESFSDAADAHRIGFRIR